MKFTLTTKITVVNILAGLLPAAVVGYLAIRAASHMALDIGNGYKTTAESTAAKIDRNLFERYGDVQAFGLNEAVNDQASWYQPGAERNRIANVANRYAALYGIYGLSYLVDLEGRVIAVNDRDPGGKPIDTGALYKKNFKATAWFQACLAGKFLKSNLLDGTYVEDLHVDEDVKSIYGGDGLVLGFSAPVKDAAGKVIGIWRNCANFSLVEEIVVDAYQNLSGSGFTQAAITLVDREGRIIVDLDGARSGGQATTPHDAGVILHTNLARLGDAAVQGAVAGKSGHHRGRDVRSGQARVMGYAACTGQLGFPGLGWGVVVGVPEAQALSAMRAQLRDIIVTLVVSVAALIALGMWLGRSITRPVLRIANTLETGAGQVSSASEQVAAGSQSLAEGASEQAASLEETSASLEEIASMVRRNAENASTAKELSSQTRHAADTGASAMDAMKQAMQAITTSSSEVGKIVKSIDEIAFQTNILALNAAVEAARAGEAGAGFSVVADEVRSLAQRSARAAKETAEKIEDAIANSHYGVEVSAKVADSLEAIVVKARHMDELVTEIAAASQEQSQGVAEINAAITQLDRVTQSNAAGAEESAAAAEELKAQVGTLQNAVSHLTALISGDGIPAAAGDDLLPLSAAPQRGAGPAAKPTSEAPRRARPGAAADEAIPMPSATGRNTIPMDDDFKDF